MLKYVIYASIFARTGLLQLSYNETKIFADDNEIKSHLELFSAAQKAHKDTIEKLIDDKAINVSDDTFITTYFEYIWTIVEQNRLEKIKSSLQRIVSNSS